MKAKDLRNSILQLAVQGKLVSQDPNDEPASVLLERIRAERAKLIKEKKIKAPKGGESVIYRASDGSHYEKRGKAEPVCIDDEIPFEIPESWEWCRIPTVTVFQEGPGILGKDFRAGGIPLIRIAGMQTERVTLEGCNYLDPEMVAKKWSHFKLDIGDTLISTSASMDKICIVDEEAAGAIPYTGQIRFKMSNALLREFFVAFIQSPAYMKQVQSFASGTAIKHYGPTHLKKMVIPIPPVEEQKRIAEKIASLMPHVTDYERIESARELLDVELPDRLRKSILQLAVQGRLVEQDPTDEPASALLERIRAERAKLVKEKKLKAAKGGESVIYRASDGGYYEKRGKGESVCIDDEIPFEIPEGWAWARMSTVATLHSGTSYKKDEIRTSGIRIVRGGNIIVPNVVLADDDVFLDEAFADNEKAMHEGDIVIVASTGSSAALGRAAYINEEMPGVQIGAFLRILRSQAEMRRWNWLMMSTEYYRSRIRLLAKGTNINNIKEAHIMDMLIPVPPIKEQSRIVSQVERLLASIG